MELTKINGWDNKNWMAHLRQKHAAEQNARRVLALVKARVPAKKLQELREKCEKEAELRRMENGNSPDYGFQMGNLGFYLDDESRWTAENWATEAKLNSAQAWALYDAM